MPLSLEMNLPTSTLNSTVVRLLIISACVIGVALPASAQELRLDKGKAQKDLLSIDKMQKGASVATRGYYDSMIKGDYEAAATFVHPFLVSNLKKDMMKAIKKLKPKVQQKAVEKLGLQNMAELENLEYQTFFKLWAKSDYAYAAATLANPQVQAKYRVEAVRCVLGKYCDVTVDVRGRNQGGKITSSKSIIRASPVEGAWRVGAEVKMKKTALPKSYKGPKLRKAQREKARLEKAKKP